MIFWNVSKSVMGLTVLLMKPSCNFMKNCKVPLTNLDQEFMLMEAGKKWVKEKTPFLTKERIDFIYAHLFLKN